MSSIPAIIPATTDPLLEYEVDFRGVNTENPGRTCPKGEAVTASNAWLRLGGLETSGGYANLAGTTPGATTEECLGLFQMVTFSAGVAVRKWLKVVRSDSGTAQLHEYAGGSWGTTKGAISGTSPCDFVQVQDTVYIASGGANVQTWNGTTLANAGSSAPGAPVTANSTYYPNGPEALDSNYPGLTAGATYGFAYTLFNSVTGDESSRSDIITRTIASNGYMWIVTIPASDDSDFDSIKMYRSAANDQTVVRYERTIGAPYWNRTIVNFSVGVLADSALGAEAPTTNNAPPAGCRAMEFWDGRLWYYGIKTEPTTLYYSRRGQPGAVPLNNNLILLDDANGQDIRGTKQHEGRLYVFKARRTFVVGPGSRQEYESRVIDTGYGFVSRHGIAVADNAIWGFGVGTLLRFNGSSFQELGPGAATYLQSVTRGAGWEQPLYLRYDWSSWRNRLLYGGWLAAGGALSDGTGASAGYIQLSTGAITKDDRNPHKKTCIATGERDGSTSDNQENRCWVLTGSRFSKVAITPGGTDGMVYDWYETAANARVWGNGLDYQTGYIDPSSDYRHKMFYGVDVLVERTPTGSTAGSLTLTAFYDDGASSESAQTIAELAAGSSNSVKLVPLVFPGATVHENIALRLLATDGNAVNHFRILAVKIYWKPKGSLSAVL